MILEMKNIQKSFPKYGEEKTPDRLRVLRNISLHVDKGEVVSIIGPSGSGKSTLLRCATFLETVDSGAISYMDPPAVTTDTYGNANYVSPAELRKIKSYYGLVFQQFNLFPHYTVLKNVMDAPLSVQKRDKAEVRENALELLRKMGLADKADAYPCMLSGGQQQRVAIARALAHDPAIIFADEPTGNLDSRNGGQILDLLFSLAEEGGKTLVTVTHDSTIAARGDRTLIIRDGVVADS